MQGTAINLDQNIWALAVLEPTELDVTCLTYSYEIKVKTTFKLIKLGNSCQVYDPNFILPSSNLIKENLNGNLITQRFFNYNFQYTNIPNFFMMTNFRLTKFTVEEIHTLANALPPIHCMPFSNINNLLKPINKNYPLTFPT